DEADKPGFRRRVVGVARPALVGAGDRARREQSSPPRVDHVRRGGAEAAEDAAEVDSEQRFPTVVVQLLEGHVAGARGGGGGGLPELAPAVRDERVDRARGGDADPDDEAAPAGGLDGRAGGLDIVGVSRIPAADDIRAGLGEDPGGGGPDPGRCAGHEGHPAVESERSAHRASSTTPAITSAVPMPRTSVIFSERKRAEPITVTTG